MVRKKRNVKKNCSRRKYNQDHHVFWFVIALVVILPVVGVLNYHSTDNISGNVVVPISYLQDGEEIIFEVQEAGVEFVAINFVEVIKGSKITTEELKVLGWDFDGVKYSQFYMACDDEEKVGSIKLTLKLEESKMLDLGMTTNNLKVFLNNEELPTKFIEKEGDYIYFEATSQEMGEFVIGKAAEIVEEIVEETEQIEEPIIEDSIEPEVTMPVEKDQDLPLTGEAVQQDSEEKGFFAWLRELFS